MMYVYFDELFRPLLGFDLCAGGMPWGSDSLGFLSKMGFLYNYVFAAAVLLIITQQLSITCNFTEFWFYWGICTFQTEPKLGQNELLPSEQEQNGSFIGLQTFCSTSLHVICIWWMVVILTMILRQRVQINFCFQKMGILLSCKRGNVACVQCPLTRPNEGELQYIITILKFYPHEVSSEIPYGPWNEYCCGSIHMARKIQLKGL